MSNLRMRTWEGIVNLISLKDIGLKKNIIIKRIRMMKKMAEMIVGIEEVGREEGEEEVEGKEKVGVVEVEEDDF